MPTVVIIIILLAYVLFVGLLIFLYEKKKKAKQNGLDESDTSQDIRNSNEQTDSVKNNDGPIEDHEAISKEQIIRNRIDTFYAALAKLGDHYIAHSEENAFSLEWKGTYEYLNGLWISRRNQLSDVVDTALERYKSLHNEIKKLNAAFVDSEIARCKALLSDIDGKELDPQQQRVVVTDEDHNLVLAGAGSGKTLTIAGKVKYLVEEKNIDPKEILLIAFTRKSAEEMTERISGKLSIPVKATTFHKLGLDIIKSATDTRPDVLENPDDFLTEYFENNLIDNQQIIQALIEFFAYYLHIPADIQKYSSLGEAYAYEKGRDFETIRSKYEKSEYVQNETEERFDDKITLLGETVKSLEEVSIANFLFLNGIEYEYERLYPFKSDDPMKKAYRPDFYLPDYDIYIEHFGINRQGRLPWLSDIEEQMYIDGMKWKRDFHKANGTTLIETYSYYSSEGILLEKLETLLKEKDVALRKRDYYEIFNAVYNNETDKYFAEFKKLCGTFITLMKSNGYGVDDLPALQDKGTRNATPFFVQRTVLFISIIRSILISYEEYLRTNKTIDFSDMIIQATDLIRNGYQVVPYKYVIIDEYQDISVARYKLVKAILDQTRAHLLCVGDDWQSIYRFAGSDISLFTRFESYFGYSEIMRIEKTYRNSQQLVDEVGRFIMQNPAQLQKSLRSSKTITYPVSLWFYEENPFSALKRMIEKLIKDFGTESSIMLLGRTAYDAELLKESKLFDVKKINGETVYKYKESPKTPIFFLTVHKAKGLETDNVIILNFENSLLGFPNKISDDPMLGLVLSETDQFPYSEERRLMYVAITRTRNRTFILTNSKKPSEFINDFAPSPNIAYIGHSEYESDALPCPRCKTGHLTVRKNEEANNYFVGCTNYPQCTYTIKDTSVMDSKRRCPACGGYLVKKNGKYGDFWGCVNFPMCNHKEKEEKRSSNNNKREIGFNGKGWDRHI